MSQSTEVEENEEVEDDDKGDENEDCVSDDIYGDEDGEVDEIVSDRMDRVVEAGKTHTVQCGLLR